MLKANVNNPVGVSDDPVECIFTWRGGDWSKGEVGMLDLFNSDPDVTNNIEGDPNSGFANVVTVDRPGAGIIIVVAMQDVADDQKGYGRITGFAEAIVTKNSGNVVAGDSLSVKAGSRKLSADVAAADRVVAAAKFPLAAPGSSGAAVEVVLEGAHGLGMKVS